jgi:hypothetical protein
VTLKSPVELTDHIATLHAFSPREPESSKDIIPIEPAFLGHPTSPRRSPQRAPGGCSSGSPASPAVARLGTTEPADSAARARATA